MSASMRAPALAALRSRWPLPPAVALVATMGRALHVGPADWIGSEIHGIFGAIVYLGLLPLLAITTGSAWLRGDLGAWTWALARPISRRRWLAWMLVIDVGTLLACVCVGAWLLGPMPSNWIGPWSGAARPVGYLAMLCAIYCAAAVGGTRGSSAVAVSSQVLVLVALLVAVGVLADDAFLRVPHLLTALGRPDGAMEFYSADFDSTRPVELTFLWAALAVTGTMLVMTGRAAARIPAVMPARHWTVPVFVAVLLGAYGFPLLLVAWLGLRAAAP